MQKNRSVLSTFIIILALFLSACSGVQPTTSKTAQPKKELAPKSSEFYPLSKPFDALLARIAMIQEAKEYIDVQYYIYEDDASSAYFSAALLDAAKRGVQVRILVDDLDTSGKDRAWMLFSAHPNISLKLFNPIKFRKLFRFAKLAFNIDSLGRRMHNKALIVDGEYAIIGGRNIGDVYFASEEEKLFLDFDILVHGVLVNDIEEMFQHYWQSQLSYAATDVMDADINDAVLQQEQKVLYARVAAFKQKYHKNLQELSKFIPLQKLPFTRARAKFFYDLPQKVATDIDDERYNIAAEIKDEFKKIQKSALIISPYFIPTKEILRQFRYLRKRGVSITIVTNSLASTDVFIVYSAYQKYIKELLSMGVEIYELKPNSFLAAKKQKVQQERISLHTKLMILDERYVTIGSANLDPRSINLNTETFMIIDSTSLAKELLREAKKSITTDDYIKLAWGEVSYPYELKDIKSEGILYITTQKGVKHIYTKPPYSGFFKILGANLLSYLPIEGYL